MAKKEVDFFTKAFGKKPKKGYKFTGLGYSFGFRSIVISWSCQGVGFGQLALIFDETGLKIDSECMSNEFVLAALKEAIKRLKKGQKADKWDFSSGTGVCVESKEAHEDFIKSVCQTFYHYVKHNPDLIKIT